jgi:hypothetical protein
METFKIHMENNPILNYQIKTIIDMRQKPTTASVKQEVKATSRVWMFRKKGTREGIVAYKKGNHFVWAKTYDDDVVADYTYLASDEFEDMINKENYELDENTFFTFTNQEFKFIKKKSPFD